MNKRELEIALRSDFTNKIKPIAIKKCCENCSSENNLIVHHDTRFCELLDKTLSDLHIKDENYSESEIKIIRNYILGLQLKIKLITLCNDCHIQLHIGLGGDAVNRKKKSNTCANKILHYVDNRLKNEDKWTSIKSSEVMKELNISNSNWNKIWSKDETFIKEIKKEESNRVHEDQEENKGIEK